MAYELTDDEWVKLELLLPKKKMGRPCLDLRRSLSAIKWVLKTGSPWRALPPEFGNWNSVYRYFCRLQEKGLTQHIGKSKGVMADKAYCSRKFLSMIERKGGIPCIPCKKAYKIGWKIDREQYKKRNEVERFFQRLKENRRLAMRFDKLADRFRAFVYFASILLWLN